VSWQSSVVVVNYKLYIVNYKLLFCLVIPHTTNCHPALDAGSCAVAVISDSDPESIQIFFLFVFGAIKGFTDFCRLPLVAIKEFLSFCLE